MKAWGEFGEPVTVKMGISTVTKGIFCLLCVRILLLAMGITATASHPAQVGWIDGFLTVSQVLMTPFLSAYSLIQNSAMGQFLPNPMVILPNEGHLDCVSLLLLCILSLCLALRSQPKRPSNKHYLLPLNSPLLQVKGSKACPPSVYQGGSSTNDEVKDVNLPMTSTHTPYSVVDTLKMTKAMLEGNMASSSMIWCTPQMWDYTQYTPPTIPEQALPSLQSQWEYYQNNMLHPYNPTGPSHHGQVKPVTILFADIRGYTSLVEQYPPNWIIHQLNEYFSVMTQVIITHNGCLDKYMGDELMAFFEAPEGQLAMSAYCAAKAALVMLQKLEELNARWEQQGLPKLDIGIGINTGEVFIGNIGSSIKMDYTVIGDHVNLASRLEELNKTYGTNVIMSDNTYQLIKDVVEVSFLGQSPVRGKQNAAKIYELIQEVTPKKALANSTPRIAFSENQSQDSEHPQHPQSQAVRPWAYASPVPAF